MRVDLIKDRQEITRPQTATPVNFVHPDRLHASQLAVRQAPGDEPFHRAIHRLPTHLEHFRRLAPTQPSRPARQKPHHGRRQRPLPFVPRQVLHDHAMLRDTPPAAARSETKRRCPTAAHAAIPALPIGHSPAPAADTANSASPIPVVPSHGNFNPLRFALPTPQPDILENKSRMGLNLIQNRFNLQLNGWSPRRRFLCCSNHRLTPPMETSLSQPRLLRRSPVLAASLTSLSFNCASRRGLTHKLCCRAFFSCSK